ncbi:hypothetical protein GB931_08380 [Modestobacter sp. I12A-02628]|uniref:Uncharacterized protein n=1 Tax=Goekera deserti TaxID=2497753 RepID=A0A7K3WF80_9ACTN|nr:hypothetical protein [Goekera deserti]MPQ97939.1 hypothetical protein [Goekera deserti]NDI48585.1 hypothetical protein [Goekera deserti]NEL55036.1 hypothetical protein [Goekera deserti]
MVVIVLIGAAWTSLGLLAALALGGVIGYADRRATAERDEVTQLWHLTDDGEFIPATGRRMPAPLV